MNSQKNMWRRSQPSEVSEGRKNQTNKHGSVICDDERVGKSCGRLVCIAK
jgi:hypothetical protein